ncbi:uncharacterized protein LOC111259977 isoform X2 [Varroa jacobsoni]|uniref:PPPDE domain-containing protein n=1 Tax=Varroa destructor TaxID=109461 RepID=A0A7M7J838_VARDE|nr:uncharacterized protein LOC111244604 isoform X2 [Varroa destructor]XP_022688128.1 uncharacterized protein LOC111259977 isoform X2 [Varroa jacobsoni]
MGESAHEVRLYVYDLSRGMARALSPMFLGKEIPAIWHTSIVAFGREYFFGGMGIESCGPGETVMGEPMQIVQLGQTEIPYALFLEYIFELGESSFKESAYDLFRHNCNTFTQEVAQFLTGRSIPQEILDLPEEILDTPFGAQIGRLLGSQTSLRSENARGISFGENARINLENRVIQEFQAAPGLDDTRTSLPQQTESPLIRNGSTGVQGANQQSSDSNCVSQMGDIVENPSRASESPERRPSLTPRKTRKFDDPAICFEPIDGTSALQVVEERLLGKLSEEDAVCFREFAEYINTDCGSWSLGELHLYLLGFLLGDSQEPKIRLATIQFLAACALKDDFILFLHQDRKSHVILNYVYKIERLPADEQDAVMILMCNFCKNNSSFDWLMYISEWPSDDGTPGACNNCKVTTRAVVHALLCNRKETQEKAAALMYNLALKELYDDQATEFATALLQYLHSELSEEASWRALVALFRFCQISYNDVPALCNMLGPDLNKFSGMSKRVDSALKDLQDKISSADGEIVS